MDDTIERRKPYVELTIPDIEQLLAPVRGRRGVASARIITSGKLNTNYKVYLKDDDRPVVLRVYTNDPGARERDAAVFDLLRGRVPLAPLLHSAPPGPDLDHPYTVFAWVDGCLLNDVLQTGSQDDVGAAVRAAGRTLAAINQFRFDRPGFLGPTLSYTHTSLSSADSFRGYLAQVEEHGRAARRVGPDEFARMIRFVDANLGCLAATEDWYSLVHADYTGTNLIVGQDAQGWTVRAVLDWEFVMAGTSVFDIGVFLRNEDRFGPDFRREFTRAFADAGGHLAVGWRRASKMLDLINQFAFLDSDGEFPNTFTDAIARIRGTMDRWAEFDD